MSNLTYEDYKSRLKMQDLLQDIGYVQNRRDGLRYPSFVRLDQEGRRIRGDKFIVTQQGNCCFQPPEQRSYNVISFIKEHPDRFADYTAGMNLDLLVNKVCCRLLNTTYEQSEHKVLEPERLAEPFKLDKYQLTLFSSEDKESRKAFYPFFKHRGLDLSTQYAFKDYFLLASKELSTKPGTFYKNLSFPIVIPGKEEIVVGFEERGPMRRNGEKPYKGKAAGTNGSEGLWIASPAHTSLQNASKVLLFESAYDAMAYYQLKHKADTDLRKAVFVSTGGNPTVKQMSGIIKNAPLAKFHLCFDNDESGRQFTQNFEFLLRSLKPHHDAAFAFKQAKGHIEIDDEKFEAFDKLQKPVRELYYKAYNLDEELQVAYLCPEDREQMKKEKTAAYREFFQSVDALIANSEREIPAEGYKDWNEQLLGERESKRAVGTDIDGDGAVEVEESNEEHRNEANGEQSQKSSEEKHRYHR